MSLQGTGFITMWHDVEPTSLDEWHAWHTHEHMPERVGIPGFRGGRRYWNDALARQRCFTLYEGKDAAVFRSPAYLERLNQPTPWTTRMSPTFRNFLRIACETVATDGIGIGGAIATWRLTLEPNTALEAAAIVNDLRAERPVIAAHVARTRPDITAYRTTEAALRPAGEEAGFDALVLAEGVSHAALAALMPEMTTRLLARPGVSGAIASVYDLSFRITTDDLNNGTSG
jgi:hypothetical protein